MPDEAWTTERVDLLKQLWANGETAGAIGAHLGGLSRSAVLGKIFRLRQNAGDAAAGAAPEHIPASNVGVEAAATLPRRRRRTIYKKRSSPPAPVVERRHKTLFELTNKTCRWPHGEPRGGCFFFCGAPEADLERGIPYCPAHMRRAYPTWTGGEAPTRTAARLLGHWR
jgi:GcrA cell cycle regulator